ncbi:hypothetical protein IP70_11585 [alpha proteobacterium AAP38]|nr:hypothetical protein IP70_11585 [alpha proteobacterium AAP38]
MWDNPDLMLFHGTDLLSANSILVPSGGRSHSVMANVHAPAAKRYLDFGAGFYLTSRLDQAVAWANIRQIRKTVKATPRDGGAIAAVLRFTVARNDLAALADLVFTDPDGGEDYLRFTDHCRNGADPANGRSDPYDVVQGPVRAWPKLLTKPSMDQISLHTGRALNILTNATIVSRGSPLIEA